MMHTDPGTFVHDKELDDAKVDIYYEPWFDYRAYRARYAVCPKSGHEYREMHWDKSNSVSPVLVCPCGERFKLSV